MDDEMSEQESETSRFPIPHPSASESAPLLTFLLTLLRLETHHRLPTHRNYVQALSKSIWMNIPKNVPELTMITVPALLSVYQHDLGKVSENLNDDKVCAGEQCD